MDDNSKEANDLLEEVEFKLNNPDKYKAKSCSSDGRYEEKSGESLAWRGYIKYCFQQNKDLTVSHCSLSFNKAESLITHIYRKHVLPHKAKQLGVKY